MQLVLTGLATLWFYSANPGHASNPCGQDSGRRGVQQGCNIAVGPEATVRAGSTPALDVQRRGYRDSWLEVVLSRERRPSRL